MSEGDKKPQKTKPIIVKVKINYIPDTPENATFYENWRAMWDMILAQAKAREDEATRTKEATE